MSWDNLSHEYNFIAACDQDHDGSVTYVASPLAGVSDALDIGSLTKIRYEIRLKSGTIGNLEIEMQCSLDGVVWDEMANRTIVGEGFSSKIDEYKQF